MGFSPHIFTHSDDAHGDPDVFSVAENNNTCWDESCQHPCFGEPAGFAGFDLVVYLNKGSTNIAQRTWKVSLKSQLDATEVFLASKKAGRETKHVTGG